MRPADQNGILSQNVTGDGPMEDTIDIEIEQESEEVRIHQWRVEQLARLGLSTVIAHAVATFVDWHDVARLVERGCPLDLALEIAR
jgi:hypothetical protein